MRFLPGLRIALCVLSLLVVGGCGGGGASGGRLGVTGTVNFKGQPLDQGTIMFLPAAGGKTQSGAPISNGKFSIPADKGLEPGTYTVTISSMEGGVAAEPGGPAPKEQPKERISEKWNTKSKETREIKAGQTKFEFNVD